MILNKIHVITHGICLHHWLKTPENKNRAVQLINHTEEILLSNCSSMDNRVTVSSDDIYKAVSNDEYVHTNK